MRASRWFSALCIMCGVSLFAMATALWPTKAYAEILDINLQWDELRLYEDPLTNVSEVDQSYIRTLSNFVTFEPQLYNYEYTPSGSTTTSGNIEYFFQSSFFNAYDSSLNNPVLVLYIPLGSSIIPQNYKIRVSFPSTAWNVQTDTSGLSSAWVDMSVTVASVWVGNSIGELSKCNYSSGGYVAPKSGRVVVILLNTTNRTGSRLLERHRYMLEGIPKLYVEIPDPTATQINDQSVINTQNIISGQQQQTDALKDTTGSNSIASGALTQGQGMYQNFSVNQLVGSVTSNISQAVNSTESDSVVTFPGMSLMGFTIQPVSIDPMTQLPVIADTVKLIVTFTFSAAFLRHIIELVHAIFGIYDYGDSTEMFGDSEKSSNHVYDG